MSTSRRWKSGLLVAAVFLSVCLVWLGRRAPVALFGARDAPVPAPRAVTLEFDVPPSVETKGAARFELRAVQIVVVASSRTLQSVNVERSAWQIRGNKAQVSFQLAAVPSGSNPVTLRLRFLSDDAMGEWSAATEGITAPEMPFVAPAARSTYRAALKQAVRDLLGLIR